MALLVGAAAISAVIRRDSVEPARVGLELAITASMFYIVGNVRGFSMG